MTKRVHTSDRDAPPATRSNSTSARCPNCGTEADSEYCPACGQSQRIETPTLGEAIADVVDELFGANPRLPRTLAALLLRPGKLTEDWLAGRRARYIRPVRLYVICSFIFFAVGLGVPGLADRMDWEVPDRDTVTEVEVDVASEANVQSVLERSRSVGPWVVLAMVPAFALLLMAFFRTAERAYLDHLVFAVHVQCFGFVVLALLGPFDAFVQPVLAAPWDPLIMFVPIVALVGYLVAALREVYDESYVWSTVKGVSALGVHAVLSFAVVLLTGAVGWEFGGPEHAVEEAHEEYWDIQQRFERGDSAEARALVSEAILAYQRLEGYQRDPHVRYHLGQLFVRAGRTGDAYDLARKGLIEDSTHVLALALAAPAARELGRDDEARTYYRRFLEAYADTIAGYRDRNSRHVPQLEATRDSAMALVSPPRDTAERE